MVVERQRSPPLIKSAQSVLLSCLSGLRYKRHLKAISHSHDPCCSHGEPVTAPAPKLQVPAVPLPDIIPPKRGSTLLTNRSNAIRARTPRHAVVLQILYEASGFRSQAKETSPALPRSSRHLDRAGKVGGYVALRRCARIVTHELNHRCCGRHRRRAPECTPHHGRSQSTARRRAAQPATTKPAKISI